MTKKQTITAPAGRQVFDAPGVSGVPRKGVKPRRPRLLTQAELEAGVPCPMDHTPNAETIAAFEEGDAMLRGEIPGKLYDSVEELIRDLEN